MRYKKRKKYRMIGRKKKRKYRVHLVQRKGWRL